MRIRPERVAHRMIREVSDILRNKIRDPRVSQWVTVTDVELTQDLSSAKVFVSILQAGEERERTMTALAGAAAYVRRELGDRLGLREVPEIRFKLDTSIETGARVDELLRRIESGEPVGDDDEADSGSDPGARGNE
jgi:ribosome-binding factor A